MVDRYERIAEEVKRELGNLILTEVKDPRLPQMVSVTEVEVTKDLKFAKVYISILGDEDAHKNALAALKSAAGFLRREIGHRIKLRNIPELHFINDNSIERSIYMSQLIDETLRTDSKD